jgi:hypothetical protein
MDARDLYGLPLERFTAERNALAKELKRDGRRDEAAAVSKLRKPSVAAWAVNQLIRTQNRAVATLFDAGDALGETQSRLLAGRGDGDALREAVARERAAVGALARMARGLLSSEGHELSPTTLERVSETLHAAALDEDARAQVRDGCLHAELRHIGLGPAAAAGTATSGGGRRPATRAPRKAAEHARSESMSAKAAAGRRQAERDQAKELSAARKAEADARRVAERAAGDLETAAQRRERAAGSLRHADEALAGARQRAGQAARAHRRAEQALKRLMPD